VGRGGIVAAHAGDMRINCRWVINAAGPWVDAIRLKEDARAKPMARLSKGAHIVIEPPQDMPWQAAVTTPLEGRRVSFAIPWEGMVLLGPPTRTTRVTRPQSGPSLRTWTRC